MDNETPSQRLNRQNTERATGHYEGQVAAGAYNDSRDGESITFAALVHEANAKHIYGQDAIDYANRALKNNLVQTAQAHNEQYR